jgi:hypothetical protein
MPTALADHQLDVKEVHYLVTERSVSVVNLSMMWILKVENQITCLILMLNQP